MAAVGCGGWMRRLDAAVGCGGWMRRLDAAVGCGGFCVVRPPGAGLCAAVRVGPPPEGGGCDPAGRAVRRRLLGATFRCGLAVRPMGGRRSAGRLGMRNFVFRRSIGGGSLWRFFGRVVRPTRGGGGGFYGSAAASRCAEQSAAQPVEEPMRRRQSTFGRILRFRTGDCEIRIAALTPPSAGREKYFRMRG